MGCENRSDKLYRRRRLTKVKTQKKVKVRGKVKAQTANILPSAQPYGAHHFEVHHTLRIDRCRNRIRGQRFPCSPVCSALPLRCPVPKVKRAV